MADEEDLAPSSLDLSVPDDGDDLEEMELPDLSWREDEAAADTQVDEVVELTDSEQSLEDADDLLASYNFV